ncbi:MAG: ankyrin repeat domain-containing protein [Halobacteriovoraceae bacterium]|jgi:uncharacterized protein|nr:ankyrin repeat domain-containing protein [Halobacteriovoraceae bacterium]MBT5093278.1 ankyrin repeat domain-containing protein [Halobacteriovoraceae bacterium]
MKKKSILQAILLLSLLSSCFSGDPNSSLLEAAEEGNLADARSAIKKGANVNTKKKKNKFTPLIIAAGKGDKAMAELLLDSGAEVDADDKKKRTPLMWAAWKGHPEIVEILIENDADLNAKSFTGASAIFFAQRSKRDDIKEMLIDAGASDTP